MVNLMMGRVKVAKRSERQSLVALQSTPITSVNEGERRLGEPKAVLQLEPPEPHRVKWRPPPCGRSSLKAIMESKRPSEPHPIKHLGQLIS